MKKLKSKHQLKFDYKILLALFIILIIVGKIIRHTILKSVLVDMSIGNGMINRILFENGWFQSLTDTGVSDAAGNASVFFRLINFFHFTTVGEFEFYITIIWNIILLLLIFSKAKPYTTSQLIFLSISIIVLNIWDFCLAKEPVQMLFFLAIYLAIISNNLTYWKKVFISLIIIVISILYYRIYYILIIMFFIIVSILCSLIILKPKNKPTIIKVLLIIILCAVGYFLFLNICKYISTESYNELIRVRLRTSVAHTEITSLFQSENLLLFSIDYAIAIFRLLFPIELLPMGIKYWPYAFYQFLLSIYVIKFMKNMKVNNKSQNLALYLYLAFLLASATFEPDFGSWVRHEAACFPLLLIITNIVVPKDVIKNEKTTLKHN
ncbi:MAG: hypothetical protein MR598_07250 [Erysipelotrichaceae bacterium]|nr:hypothetical protein [Erysipelotrichaceae bacterium]